MTTLTESDIDNMNHETELDDIREDVYTSDEIERGGAQLRPRRVLHNNTPMLDQKGTDGCGSFSITKGANELNSLQQAYEWIKNNEQTMGIWELCCQKRGGKQPWGSTMQQNLNMMMSLWLIGGYYKATTEEDQRIAIANGAVIYIWSKFFDFKKFLYQLWAVFSNSMTFGHLVIRTGYDDDLCGFIHANSRWTVVNDNWLFMTKYGQSGMYTPIVLVPKEHKPVIDQVTKDRILMQKAKDLWIRNTLRPTDPITSEEVKIVLWRLWKDTNSIWLKPGATFSRCMVWMLLSTIFATEQSQFWNSLRPNDLCTRHEFVLMSMRLSSLWE